MWGATPCIQDCDPAVRSDQPIARRTYRLYTALKSRRCDDRSLLLRPRRGDPRCSMKLKRPSRPGSSSPPKRLLLQGPPPAPHGAKAPQILVTPTSPIRDFPVNTLFVT